MSSHIRFCDYCKQQVIYSGQQDGGYLTCDECLGEEHEIKEMQIKKGKALC